MMFKNAIDTRRIPSIYVILVAAVLETKPLGLKQGYGFYPTLKIFITSRRKKRSSPYRFNTAFLGGKKKKGMTESLKKVLEQNKLIS